MAQVGKAGDRPPVISDGLPSQLPDIDPEETSEWLEYDGHSEAELMEMRVRMQIDGSEMRF